jgi:hypothetical protein
MSLSEWKHSEGSELPLTIIAKIVRVKNAKYFNELWNKDSASRERVKAWVREAEDSFKDICL